MILLPPLVMQEIHRYLHENCWEWRTICKVINFKFGYRFEIFEIEDIYNASLPAFRASGGLLSGRAVKKA